MRAGSTVGIVVGVGDRVTVGVDVGSTVGEAFGETEADGVGDGRNVCVAEAACVFMALADGEAAAERRTVLAGVGVGGTGREVVRVGATDGVRDGGAEVVGIPDGVVTGDAVGPTGVLARSRVAVAVS